MCQFKSGIILKNKCVIAQGADDSHSDLLEQLNIEDTRENSLVKFVRAELIPPNNEWWTDPSTWEFNVDQDTTPNWFEEDMERYLEEFKAAVKEWWKVHVLVDQKIDELTDGYYRLKRCEVKRLCKEVQAMLDNSTVQRMLGNSTVQRMWGNSTVQRMLGNSTVQRMLGNSTVQEMWGNSTVQEMWGNSTVQRMLGNSTVQRMWGNSTVQEMWGNSTVQRMWGNSTVQEMWGNSTVQRMLGNSIARDLSNGIIHVAKDTSLEVKSHENKEEEK